MSDSKCTCSFYLTGLHSIYHILHNMIPPNNDVTSQVYTALDAQPGIDLNADPNAPNLLLIGQQSSATTMVSSIADHIFIRGSFCQHIDEHYAI